MTCIHCGEEIIECWATWLDLGPGGEEHQTPTLVHLTTGDDACQGFEDRCYSATAS